MNTLSIVLCFLFRRAKRFQNRRAAGAVCIIRNQRLVFSFDSSGYRRPGGEAFCLFCVFCGLNFRDFRAFRGFKINSMIIFHNPTAP